MKIETNKLIGTQKKVEAVVKLMLKHWRTLDSTGAAMRVGKIYGFKHKILFKQDVVVSYEKLSPLNPMIKEEVEKTL